MAENKELQEFLDSTGLSHLWSRLKVMLAGKEESGAASTVQGNLNSHTGNKENPHGVTKTQVGLGNVDNTSDADKPVSTAQAAAIADAKKAGTDAHAVAQAAAQAAAAAQGTADGKEASGTAANKVNAHNTATDAHNDLRLELKALSDRINAALDSDDETLDELSEIVAYIKSNKELIEAITTSKVNVSDIVNDLVTNVSNKPLSAAQGVALTKLIDDLAATIPAVDTALSDGSTNPVQNKVVAAALAGKAPTQFVMTLTVGDNNSYTIDKTFAELEAAIQAGSQIRLVDTSGMEYVLVAFAAGYMAYFAHWLNSARHLIGFRYNNTIIYTNETPYTTNNKPKPADIGLTTETWTFTLEDESTVTKAVYVG